MYKTNEYTYDRTKGGFCTLIKSSYSLGEGQAAFRIDSVKTDYVFLGTSIYKNIYKPSFLRTSSILVQTGEKEAHETKFEYDGRFQLYRKTQEPNQPQYKVIELGGARDNYGNAIGLNIIPAEGDQYTQTYTCEYGSKGRFKTKETNPLGHITRYEYDPCLGTLLKTTNANNLSTTYEYDKWGNLTKQTTPEGNITQITTKWVTPQMNVAGAAYYTQVTSTIGYPTTTYYDALGRVIKTITQTAFTSAAEVHTETQYDELGRVAAISYPHAKTASPTWKTFGYDIMNRVNDEKGLHLQNYYVYSPLNKVTYDEIKGVLTNTLYNEMGQVIEVSDPGGSIQYAYTAAGLPKTVTTNGKTISMQYNLLGNKTKLQDPNAGTTTYTYNSLGLMTSTTNAYGKTTQYEYDKLNRVTSEIKNNETIKNVYDPTNCLGALAYKQGVDDKIEYTYDSFGRLLKQTETIKNTKDNSSYNLSYTYNNNGTLKSLQYPNSFLINYEYNTYGVRTKITNSKYGILWELKNQNAYGNKEELYMANGKLKTIFYYHYPSSSLNAIKTDNTQNNQMLHYIAYMITGTYYGISNHNNLITEKHDYSTYSAFDNRFEKTMEFYSYGSMQRLTQSNVNNISTNYYYNSNGNMSQHTGTGNYQYAAQQPNAVSSIALNSIADIREATCSTTFHPYTNKVQTIEEGLYKLNYTYGVNDQRTKGVATETYKNYDNTSTAVLKYKGMETETQYMGYLYEYEKQSKILYNVNTSKDSLWKASERNTCYIYADGHTPIAMFRETSSVNSDQTFGSNTPRTPNGLFYFLTDHLGSVEAVVDTNGNVLQRLNYTAWGNRRNPYNWNMKDTTTMPYITNRGFTGHEHLDQFNIINMRGRLYDPAIGRFFSPDPFVQMPYNTQNYNRYSYCLNNPLMYTDPTGYQIYKLPENMSWLIDEIVVSATGNNYIQDPWRNYLIFLMSCWSPLNDGGNQMDYYDPSLGSGSGGGAAAASGQAAVNQIYKTQTVSNDARNKAFDDNYRRSQENSKNQKPGGTKTQEERMQEWYRTEYDNATDIVGKMRWGLHLMGLTYERDRQVVEAASKPLTIGGQAIANCSPVTQGLNIYNMIESGGTTDFWGNELNEVGQISTILGPVIPIQVSVPIDVGNGIYQGYYRK